MVRTRLMLVAAVGVMLAAWMLWPHDMAPDATSLPEAEAPIRTVFPLPAEPVRPAPSPPSHQSVLLHDEDEANLAWVEGTVFEEDGRPASHASVFVRAADGSSGATAIDADGHFKIAVPIGTGEVYAVRWDGFVQVHSTRHAFAHQPGDTTHLDLELPAHFAGDPGLVATAHRDGFQIAWVVPDSPADRLGLAKGDVILAVDGTPAGQFDEASFEAALVGAEGTEVAIQVRMEDGTESFEEELALVRASMETFGHGARDSG